MKVYLDNGATTKASKEVVEEINKYLTDIYGNASSIHTFGEAAKAGMDEARKIIAKKLNAEPEEIIFTSGGTESDNLAIKGATYANKDKGNHIITSKIEHHAVLHSCKSLEKEGYKVTYLDVGKDGMIDPQDVKKAITKETILVTIMHANNEIGTIQPIEEIGKICKEKKVCFHTDAVQSFTKVPLDVRKTEVDMISISAHKIHGPKGIGALYVRKGTRIKPLFDGGSHEFKIRPGTENVAGMAGFAKAVSISSDNDCKKMKELRDMLIDGLLKVPNTQLNGDREKRLCNNVNIAFNFIEGESMLALLDMEGIAVSTGSACTSKTLEPSHVLVALGLKHEVCHGSIRFTLSKYTTEEEIRYTIQKVKAAVERLRVMSPLTEDGKD